MRMSELKVGKYQTYPEYKDSGVEWLGDIPIHWKAIKHKYLASFIKGKNPSELLDNKIEGSLPYLSMDNLRGNVSDKFAIPSKGMYVVNLNQPLIIWDGSNAGEFVRGKLGILSSTMAAATLIATLSKQYYWYLCKSIEPEMRKHANGMGIPHVNGDELKSIFLSIPSFDEQAQIANFLDHETAKIDALIEKQQQLIKLLKEKRQAVISHAVTKGLNPQAPMKNSGVEWLGEVPAHWYVGRLGYFAFVGNGATPSRENQKYWSNGTVGWLNSSKVNDVVITETEQFITPLAELQTSVQSVKPNDLVIAITGEGQTRGRVAICQLKATINQHLASISIYDNSLHYEFLFLWLSANYERIRFESAGAGSTKGAITCGDIKSYPVIIAPLAEQLEIVNYIEGHTTRFFNLLEKANHQVNLLKERRTALISAAVTGKIDVRNWEQPND